MLLFQVFNNITFETVLSFIMCSTNGFTSEDDSRGGHDQVCCLVDNSERCQNQAGNASYSKRIQKTVQQRKLKLIRDDSVGTLGIHFCWV